jgi:hypothetical protein
MNRGWSGQEIIGGNKHKLKKTEAASVYSLPRNTDYYNTGGSYKSLVPPKYVNMTGPGDYNH